MTNYVRQSWGNDAPTNATEGRVSGLRAVTETAELASAAASCGNVPEDAVGDSFRRRIQDLASARELDPEAVATLGEEFAEANPDTANANRVAWLSGLYCQQVASSGAPTATVIEQHLTFMNAL